MPIGPYFSFAVAHRRFVGFGFLIALVSSFGQTYFIGSFGPSIQEEFSLSHTAWGTIYLAGTLASAIVLPVTGRLIDLVDLRTYTAAVLTLMVGACAVFALTTGPWMLVAAIFLLRHSGQGLLSHVAATSMSRYFEAGRGKAIAIAALGFVVGEASLPFLAVASIAAIGWRWTYGGISLLLVAVLVPGVLWLLRGHAVRHAEHLERLSSDTTDRSWRRSWTRAEVLRDPRFYLLLPGLMASSVIFTAMFFHHLTVAAAKGWSSAFITGNYVFFAATATIASLVAGQLIDRHGALRWIPLMLVPLALGMVVLASFDHPSTAVAYLALIGVTNGVVYTAVSAMWAELYGVGHLGAIKSLAAALSVLGSALGPVAMGALMDAGITISQISLMFAAYALLGCLLNLVALTRTPPGGAGQS